MHSLNVDLNQKMVFKATEGQGASGSFFFFTHDNRFTIKTMTAEEVHTLEEMLEEYVEYLLKNKGSLISRIYGVFLIETDFFDPLYIML